MLSSFPCSGVIVLCANKHNVPCRSTLTGSSQTMPGSPPTSSSWRLHGAGSDHRLRRKPHDPCFSQTSAGCWLKLPVTPSCCSHTSCPKGLQLELVHFTAVPCARLSIDSSCRSTALHLALLTAAWPGVSTLGLRLC